MPTPRAYVNAIATACPPQDGQRFWQEQYPMYLPPRERALFQRLLSRCQIDHRYCCLIDPEDPVGFYPADPSQFPGTGKRMAKYEQEAPKLAHAAAAPLLSGSPAAEALRERITHLVVGSCTGFYAPGVDCDLVKSLRLSPRVKRRIVGFMGCYAGLSVLQTAHDIVGAEPSAVVLSVNVELCSLHLQRPTTVEQAIAAAQFSDGAAATVVSAHPSGLAISDFRSRTFAAGANAITWHITDQGFAMYLDPHLPQLLDEHVLTPLAGEFLGGVDVHDPSLAWAVHPGGRSVLDAVQTRWRLEDEPLHFSRSVLRRFGNMSSATVLFVLRDILASPRPRHGLALAFGPGLAVESMRFSAIPGAPAV